MSDLTKRLDQTEFVLDDREFNQFIAFLESPDTPNPGYDRLMAVEPSWAESDDDSQSGT